MLILRNMERSMDSECHSTASCNSCNDYVTLSVGKIMTFHTYTSILRQHYCDPNKKSVSRFAT